MKDLAVALILTMAITFLITKGVHATQAAAHASPVPAMPQSTIKHPCEAVSAKECYDRANVAGNAGRISEAVDFLRYACVMRDFGQACNDLGGVRFRAGQIGEAKRLYEKACALKTGLGCSNRGCLDNPYAPECKSGAKADVVAAQRFYARGCERKDKTACFNEGNLMKKLGYKADSHDAFGLSCLYGDEDACANTKGWRGSSKLARQVQAQLSLDVQRREEAQKFGFAVTPE